MTEFVIDKVDGVLVIRIQLERATLSKAGLFKDTLLEKMQQDHRRFIVDCRNIEYMDSTFLGSMVVSLKKLKALNGDLRLVFSDKNSPIWIMFEATRMFKVFKNYLSLEEAVESFATSKKL